MNQDERVLKHLVEVAVFILTDEKALTPEELGREQRVLAWHIQNRLGAWFLKSSTEK